MCWFHRDPATKLPWVSASGIYLLTSGFHLPVIMRATSA
jgi:hypothetical protein